MSWAGTPGGVSILGTIDEVARNRPPDHADASDALPEDRFGRITRLARQLFGVQHAEIALIDHDRRWVTLGSGELLADKPRSQSFCNYTVRHDGAFVVPNVVEDERFSRFPVGLGDPSLRFYAGYPLEAVGGERFGILCVFDSNPRVFTDAEKALLKDLGIWVQNELAVGRDLERAAEVQRGLLPRMLLSLPGFDVAGACTPAQAVGGDFYDWYPTPEGAAFTLADVMGKGMGAAIIAATVRAVLRTGSRRSDIGAAVESAASVLENDLEAVGTFVTLFHGRLNMDTGLLRYIDAGHGLSLVVHADGTSKRLRTTSPPLGFGFEAGWREHRVLLNPGDSLVSVSDGVLDLYDGTLASLDEVEKLVRRSAHPSDVVDELMRLAGSTASDDVTAIVVRRALD